MGYADGMRFKEEELALLDTTKEIEIETALPGGPAHRTIIWVVVAGDEAFVRSVKGKAARWYREAVANPSVTIHAGDAQLAAQAEPATDPSSVARTSAALERKYAGDPGTKPMLRPDVLDTTLRLAPA